MTMEKEISQVLRHDLHKIRVAGALTHNKALQMELARNADGFAAWMGRNFLKEPFKNDIYRKSLIFQTDNLQSPRTLMNQHRLEVAKIFNESNSFELHTAILHSKLLNYFCEARKYPYTSLKYHILLTCALYYNFKSGYDVKDLYLCENLSAESPFQIIYEDNARKWAILPQRKNNLSKLLPQFSKMWERRKKLSFGGDYQILDQIISSIRSWTVALATIEDFFTLVKK